MREAGEQLERGGRSLGAAVMAGGGGRRRPREHPILHATMILVLLDLVHLVLLLAQILNTMYYVRIKHIIR